MSEERGLLSGGPALVYGKVSVVGRLGGRVSRCGATAEQAALESRWKIRLTVVE
jgi:hypothetical protein